MVEAAGIEPADALMFKGITVQGGNERETIVSDPCSSPVLDHGQRVRSPGPYLTFIRKSSTLVSGRV
jgi:hypothetical protein